MDDPNAWSISFECDTAKVPTHVLDVVRGHLVDMGPALVRIRQESPFWTSVRESGLSMEVGGWKFKFRVDHGGATCIEVAPALLL